MKLIFSTLPLHEDIMTTAHQKQLYLGPQINYVERKGLLIL